MTLTPAARVDTRHHLHACTQLRQLARDGLLVIVKGGTLADTAAWVASW
jgi:hypothetical protein